MSSAEGRNREPKFIAHIFVALTPVVAMWPTPPCAAAPPQILHTSGYESPARGEPDGLLALSGLSFETNDRVVYQAVPPPSAAGAHPNKVPERSTAALGTAPIVHLGSPPDSLVVRLPKLMRTHQVYRLWVVNAAGEWSEPLTINDPRPLWVSPPYLNATADVAGLGRRIRVIGRNLDPDPNTSTRIRLAGPATYVLSAQRPQRDASILQEFVAEAKVPRALVPGRYWVALSRDGRNWTELHDQRLEVRADPAPRPHFDLEDPQFGNCRPNDGAFDDTCLALAIRAAGRAAGGVIDVPAGTWDLSNGAEFVFPPNVELAGAGARRTLILRHDAGKGSSAALLLLTHNNSVTDIGFTDTDHYQSAAHLVPVIQVGVRSSSVAPGNSPSDIVISRNAFVRVGQAVSDGGHPIARLFVTHNEFGAYYVALELFGHRQNLSEPYRVEDSVIRMNRFVPGSYVAPSARQGTLASELGAALRVDFSDNVADGTATEALQSASDPKGWRAAFFWNMEGNHEFELVSENRISCSGDKAGDGEALAFDANGDTYAFNGAPHILTASADSVTAHEPLIATQSEHPIDRETYYLGDWVQVVAGPGTGEVRRIIAYHEDPASGNVTFEISPGWDVVPSEPGGRIIVGREFRQLYVVGNQSDQRSPPCTKANVSGAHGGAFSLWAPSADTVIAGNTQFDSDGIVFQQGYSVESKSCGRDHCDNLSMFQSALEIRDNRIEGEYDPMSDCTRTGILGSYAASPTPESPPPILGSGILIAHNEISHAERLMGGAIEFAPSWFTGPPPGYWALSRDILIVGNSIQGGSSLPPRHSCGSERSTRTGIRLGTSNVRDAVLYDNTCRNVDVALQDLSPGTLRICPGKGAGDCECPANPD